jgi:hypothetical protein
MSFIQDPRFNSMLALYSSLLDGNAGEKVRAFLGMCALFLEPGFDRDTLLNGDETTIYTDPDWNP